MRVGDDITPSPSQEYGLNVGKEIFWKKGRDLLGKNNGNCSHSLSVAGCSRT